jgi:hypothetical protein
LKVRSSWILKFDLIASSAEVYVALLKSCTCFHVAFRN